MSKVDINRVVCKLRLIQHGLLAAAEEIDDISALSKSEVDDEESGDDVEVLQTRVIDQRSQFVKKSIKASFGSSKRKDWDGDKISSVMDARKQVVKEFMNALPKTGKCSHCQG
jgi:DNA-directed RNA polymerase I subunit RPA1